MSVLERCPSYRESNKRSKERQGPTLSVRFTEVSIPGGGALPYMGYMGMCRCEGYGFQVVYSRIGYINQSVWV